MEQKKEKISISKRKPNRKLDILKAMVEMLQHPHSRRITTKELAEKLNLSEAALYRHFASKAQMYDALIDSVESTLMRMINQIEESENSGLSQAYIVATSMISMCRTQPGLPVLLAGDFLASEDERLYKHIELVLNAVRGRFRQCLRLAVMQGEITGEYQVDMRADLLLSLIIGQWTEFCKTGKVKEDDLLSQQIKFVIAP